MSKSDSAPVLVGSSSSSSSDAAPVSRPKSDAWIYSFGIFLGLLAGFVEVKVGDLLLTAFVVVAFTMLLGVLRNERPWRWALVVPVCIPLARVFAAYVLHEYTERAQIYESFLAFLPAIAGAYGGSVLRRVAIMLMKQGA